MTRSVAQRAKPPLDAVAPGGNLPSEPMSPSRLALMEFTSNKGAVGGLILLLLMLGFCFIGPAIYHTDQIHTNINAVRLPPSAEHPLGTNELGYDMLGRIMVGGQATIEIGVGAGLIAGVIGTLWGAVAGFVGGIVDAAMMRVVDALLSMPTLMLLIVLTTIVHPSVVTVTIILGLISWLVSARLMRGETLTVRTRLYVEAARMFGGRNMRTIVRHVIPNAIGTIIVYGTFLIADSILAVAYLSFLGLGLPPPQTTWGDLLSNGINYVYDGYWWLIYPPAIAIILLVMSFNLIGDGLRDAFAIKSSR
jgi:peptide/nickel transport system permease protein